MHRHEAIDAGWRSQVNVFLMQQGKKVLPDKVS
jgi:hypothetical protein